MTWQLKDGPGACSRVHDQPSAKLPSTGLHWVPSDSVSLHTSTRQLGNWTQGFNLFLSKNKVDQSCIIQLQAPCWRNRQLKMVTARCAKPNQAISLSIFYLPLYKTKEMKLLFRAFQQFSFLFSSDLSELSNSTKKVLVKLFDRINSQTLQWNGITM